MRFLRWLQRTLKGLRDRIVLLVQGFSGPPIEALARVLRSLRERIDKIIELLLDWWRRIWEKAPGPEGEAAEELHGAPGMPLVATAILGVSFYVVPVEDLLGGSLGLFIPLAVAVWTISLVILLRSCRGVPTTPIRRALADVERRTGLVWFERFGAVASVVLMVVALGSPGAFPLAFASIVSFVVVLGRRYEERILGPVRPDLGPLPEITDPEGWEQRDFSWQVTRPDLEEHGEATVMVQVARYHATKAGNPGFAAVDQMVRWVLEGITEEVDSVSRTVRSLAEQRNLSTFREVCHVLAFVQAIEYSFDVDSTGHEEHWRYPIETLFDRTGDCEDSSILAAAVLHRLGHQVVLVDLPGHIALGVAGPQGLPGTWLEHRGVRYYYCETTATGWQVGELPPSSVGQKAKVLPLGT